MIRRLRQWQRNLRLARKIQMITLLATCISLLFASLFIGFSEVISQRQDMVDYVSTLADATGKNSAAALTFNDVDLALQVLDSMAADPQITLAALYRTDGGRLTGNDFGVDTPPEWKPHIREWLQAGLASTAPRYLFDGFNSLHLTSPVSFDGETVGFIYIRSSLDKLIAKAHYSLLVMFLAVLAASLVAYLLATRLQRLITHPVAGLMGLTEKVSRDGDFSLRGKKLGDDEIGALVDGFNSMLAELQSRDGRLRNHREELEKKVSERTQSLEAAVAQLRVSKERAEAASRAKSEFLARMSHEIRTPMNGVLGMTEILMTGTQLDVRQKKYAVTIRNSANSLLDIINDILDFSKIEAGKLELDNAPFDLSDTIGECVELLAERAHAKDLELILDMPADLHSAVVGDSVRVRQVLVNFVSNAIKFTQQGEIVVRVRELQQDADSSLFRIAVSDTGIGIKQANMDRIFESFSQEDGSTTRRFGGTGLGLAICKQLVELMRGEIEVDSLPGRGSTFSFTVSLGRERIEASQLAPEALSGLRALIVDDNATNREVLREQLRGWQMEVSETDSGAAAIQQFSSDGAGSVDVVLLDMHMPGMDGIEVARRLSAAAKGQDLKIVMLSSMSANASDTVLEQVGIHAWLAKPVRQRHLYRCLQNLLNRELPVEHEHERSGQSDTGKLRAVAALNVLVVEDNPVNQEVARGMLSQLNCVTQAADNGARGLDAFMAGEFDLVLMDCQMPEMDGFQATRRIREWESRHSRARTPIIALTANALDGDRERCLAAGMDDYLSKPFTRQQLARAIQAALPDADRLDTTAIVARQTFIGQLVDLEALEANQGPANGGDEPVIDPNVLAGIEELQQPGQPSLLGEVIALFLKSSREQRRQLIEAVATADATSIWQLAHALKSSSGNVGAIALVSACARLEKQARAGELAEVQQMHAALCAAHDGAIIGLHEYMNKAEA